MPLLVEHNVGRFDVTVNDSFCMCMVQRQTNLPHHSTGIFRLDKFSILPISRQYHLQIGSFDVLHCHIETIVSLSVAVQSNNVWMIQLGDCPGFTLEAHYIV